MVRISYVGPDPEESWDVTSRSQAREIIDTSNVSQASVLEDIATAVALKGSQSYINNADSTFALATYYPARDNLNVPTASRGVADGVAALDGSSKIPLAQMPTLGSGYCRGPFGITGTPETPSGVTSTPAKLADFEIGVQSIAFRPLVYAAVMVDTDLGALPVVEARISDGSAAYGSQTLIGRGIGQTIWGSGQAVTVLPVGAAGAAGSGSYPVGMNIWVSLWVYSQNSQAVSVGTGGVCNAAVLLLRNAA